MLLSLEGQPVTPGWQTPLALRLSALYLPSAYAMMGREGQEDERRTRRGLGKASREEGRQDGRVDVALAWVLRHRGYEAYEHNVGSS